MTTKDKTGDQLMASIRKTKTEGAAPEEASADAPKAAPTSRKKATAKAEPAGATATRPRATKKKAAAKPRATRAAAKAAPTGYQSHGRVWPD